MLQNPGAPVSLYAAADVTDFIAQARGQLAGEGRCIRLQATINTVIGQRVYDFANINTGVAATNGIQGVLHVRSILYDVGDGQAWLESRAWQWFAFFYLNNPVPGSGQPESWAQYGQGASGSIYIDPLPDTVYRLTCDCVCYPADLTTDNSPEAIPYLWTDAVPYLAAYYALQGSQASARLNDAERLLQAYQMFVQRARAAANPTVGSTLFEDSDDPTKIAKLGLQRAANGGGQ